MVVDVDVDAAALRRARRCIRGFLGLCCREVAQRSRRRAFIALPVGVLSRQKLLWTLNFNFDFPEVAALSRGSARPHLLLLDRRLSSSFSTTHTTHDEAITDTKKRWREDSVSSEPLFLTLNASLTCVQLSQTRLVAGRRMVLATQQLEDQYRHHERRRSWNCRLDMELERGAGVQE